MISYEKQLAVSGSTLEEDLFETEDYFNTAVKSLPPVRKKVFMLNRLQGLSYKEIAQQLSISINTVEDHMSKALRQIRTLITSFLF